MHARHAHDVMFLAMEFALLCLECSEKQEYEKIFVVILRGYPFFGQVLVYTIFKCFSEILV